MRLSLNTTESYNLEYIAMESYSIETDHLAQHDYVEHLLLIHLPTLGL